ncbi:MAG: pilus assembly protein HicB [Nocardioides sp.]|nr:pilus assembly protein HicB [Nocardioides sp.]
MDITPYVEGLRRDLLSAAEAAGPETRAAAERLTYALDPSARLALMEAISQAAAEITAEMPRGGVDVRLNGRELDFVVEAAPAPAPPTPPAAPTPPLPPSAEEVEDDALTRITLRLPESVKTRAEELASRSGHSLNTWLVNVVRAATQDHAAHVDLDLSSIPFFGNEGPGGRRTHRRMTGWV